jgi:DNA topoisomerase-6 subunit A
MAKDKMIKSVFNTGNNVDVVGILEKVVLQIMDDLDHAKKPVIQSTKEAMDNAVYDKQLGILIPGDKMNSVQLDVSSIKKMTRMLFVARILINNLKSGAVNSAREIYYISKGFIKNNKSLAPLDFKDQSECDAVIAELSAISQAYKEDYNVVSNEKSGLTYSKALLITETLPNGKKVTLDLGMMGTAPYIPKNKPQDLKVEVKKGHKIDFILAIESEGTANTFVSNGFLERNDAIIIALGGQAANSVRGFLHLMQKQLGDIPLYIFTDLDAFSMTIFRSIKSGAYNSLLRSKSYTSPNARFLGILPSDIKKYDLNYYEVDPKDPTENRALKRAEDLLKNDPFFADKKNKKYRDILTFLFEKRTRVEQQALFSVYPKDPTGPERILLAKIKNGDWI